jgi:hypothetical protein
MAKKEKRDLLIHFDEEKQVLIFYTAPVGDTAAIRTKAFGGVRPDVQFFREKGPDEAERVIGSMVFSIVDLYALNKIGIRDYAALADEAHIEYVADLESRAAQNDAEAQYHLFVEYHSRTLKSARQSDLDEAERLLKASAAGGFSEAKSRLANDWELMKGAAERRIKRGPAA